VSTVLVIDDDQDARDLLTRAFKNEGFHTEIATDGKEGIETACQIQPQFITLDVMLPKMDGWLVLKELKANKITSSIPVIIISIVDNKLLARELGAVDSYTKPINWGNLMETTKRAIRSNNADIVYDKKISNF